MTFVVPDTSTWARRIQPPVADALSRAIDRNAIAVVPTVRLELLRSARGLTELQDEALLYDALRQVDLTPEIGHRALAVQRGLARRGYHRGVSAIDLLTAACAELADAEIWHCDRDFELIADVTGQAQRRVGE
jgi:predicted nucleic acid-binding protein